MVALSVTRSLVEGIVLQYYQRETHRYFSLVLQISTVVLSEAFTRRWSSGQRSAQIISNVFFITCRAACCRGNVYGELPTKQGAPCSTCADLPGYTPDETCNEGFCGESTLTPDGVHTQNDRLVRIKFTIN